MRHTGACGRAVPSTRRHSTMPTDANGTAPSHTKYDRVIQESLAELERQHSGREDARSGPEPVDTVVFVNDVGLRVRTAASDVPESVQKAMDEETRIAELREREHAEAVAQRERELAELRLEEIRSEADNERSEQMARETEKVIAGLDRRQEELERREAEVAEALEKLDRRFTAKRQEL